MERPGSGGAEGAWAALLGRQHQQVPAGEAARRGGAASPDGAGRCRPVQSRPSRPVPSGLLLPDPDPPRAAPPQPPGAGPGALQRAPSSGGGRPGSAPRA